MTAKAMPASSFIPYPDPKPVLEDDELYIGDNGRVLHGKCSGASARFSGRDISGQRVQKVGPSNPRSLGYFLTCEVCDNE